jgi:hypothetical protein
MTRNQRTIVLGLAAVVAVIGFVIARQAGGDGDSTATTATVVQRTVVDTTGRTTTVAQKPAAPQPPLILVKGGKPVGGVEKLRVAKGGTVDFRVRADAPEEVHVHGYDIKKELSAGKAARVSFPATIEGRFEIELEHAGVQIAQLEVTP